ncbi:MAG: hypothetical protein WCY05_02685 [Candidatus Omnitrophota bacterium]
MKKGLVLVVVVGIMIVLAILSISALSFMTTESRVAEHKIRRTQAYFASQAGIVDGLEQLRRGAANGGIAAPTAGNATAYCLPNTVNGYTPLVVIVSQGTNFVVNSGDYPSCSSGGNYNCTATSPAPYCVFATVDDYSR